MSSSTRIPWARVLVEGAVIVTSILLALGADALWQRNQEERQESEYVERLIGDLESDVSLRRTQAAASLGKQASLDQALAWVRSPDFSSVSVGQLLDALTEGTRMAYGVTLTTRRATYAELVSTGELRVLAPDVRRAVVGYYWEADIQRARITSRETAYAGKVYELIPRDPEFTVRADLTEAERLQIAERAARQDLEGLIIAERNHGRLVQEAIDSLLAEATTVLTQLEN